MSNFTLPEWIQQIETEIAASQVHNNLFRKEIESGTVSGIKIEIIEKGRQKLKWLKELQRYKDLEEAGRLIELDDSLPARDELDRCTHRHCNNCDKYRRELKHYKDLADEGRLIELPCKVGDYVYDVADGTAYETRVLQFVMFEDHLACRTVSSFPDVEAFGKRVFLTKAEAEQKLAELKGE